MRALAAFGVFFVVLLVGCSDPATEPSGPEPTPAIADGEWFALVIVGEDETEQLTLGVDLADMLSGEEARTAAIEDGFIAEGEDLPNDFYIRNPEVVHELLHLDDDPRIELISSSDTSQMIDVTPEELEELYEGTHPSPEGFYLAPLSPIPVEVTVTDGEIDAIVQVYLP